MAKKKKEKADENTDEILTVSAPMIVKGHSFWAIFIASVSSAIFIGAMLYGVMAFFLDNHPTEPSQATLVIVESILGFLVSVLPMLMLRFFRIKMSLSVQIIITLFMLMSVICGETLEFYYTIPLWDNMLHAFSGFGVTYIAFCLVEITFRNSNFSKKFAVAMIGAVLMSFAIGFIWEIIEFTIDTLFGTNMQKFMPNTDPFFNGGKTDEAIGGTPEDFYNFFSRPGGYRFALMDTMVDLACCFFGSLAFMLFGVAMRKSKLFVSAFERDKTPKPPKPLKREKQRKVAKNKKHVDNPTQ